MFQFGKNWKSYSEEALNAEKIAIARKDFNALTKSVEFQGKLFLDIGFGQGLASFLASEKGANVVAIDIDKDNLEATTLTAQHFSNLTTPKPDFRIASILDPDLTKHLAPHHHFDIVHSWGVLHHTGDLRHALERACSLVANGGHLVVAIYNTHWTSPYWKVVKRIYQHIPPVIRTALIRVLSPLFSFYLGLLGYKSDKLPRGMNLHHDINDWLGGYPYEYRSRIEIEQFVEARGFRAVTTIPAIVPTGNNQWVFERHD